MYAVWMHFIPFSCFIAQARASSATLNKNSESRQFFGLFCITLLCYFSSCFGVYSIPLYFITVCPQVTLDHFMYRIKPHDSVLTFL